MADNQSTGYSTPALDISRPPTPPSPDPHSSPSFDYHEQRRLHLKDEVYFSHRLPRLPPPALGEGSGSVTGARSQTMPSGQVAGADISPSAFHPIAPYTNMRKLTLDQDEDDQGGISGEEEEDRIGMEGLPKKKKTAPLHMLHPQSDGQEPVERDAQERLDLEEERRERLLVQDPSGLDAGGKKGGAQTQTGGMGASMIDGESFLLHAFHPTSPARSKLLLPFDRSESPLLLPTTASSYFHFTVI